MPHQLLIWILLLLLPEASVANGSSAGCTVAGQLILYIQHGWWIAQRSVCLLEGWASISNRGFNPTPPKDVVVYPWYPQLWRVQKLRSRHLTFTNILSSKHHSVYCLIFSNKKRLVTLTLCPMWVELWESRPAIQNPQKKAGLLFLALMRRRYTPICN